LSIHTSVTGAFARARNYFFIMAWASRWIDLDRSFLALPSRYLDRGFELGFAGNKVNEVLRIRK
jgi:hypothetical protein